MRAIVRDQYGPPSVLHLVDLPEPEVGDDGVLVRVHAASVNPADAHLTTGTPYLVHLVEGMRRPKQRVGGSDLGGVVEAVGPKVTGVAVGDRVVASAPGAWADVARTTVDKLAVLPDEVTFAQAAALPIAGVTALLGLRRGGVQPGDRVLVNGASGGVGSFAVQLATWMGAEVTGTCSTRNLDLVTSLGAKAIDHTTTDLPATGEHFDVILDMIGNWSVSACHDLLDPGGRYVIVGTRMPNPWVGPFGRFLHAGLRFALGDRKLTILTIEETAADLATLAQLTGNATIAPVLGERFPLERAAAAMELSISRRTIGKSILELR